VAAVSAARVAHPADSLLQLAVLLQAGLSPVRAWEQLADGGDPMGVSVCAQIRRGTPLADAVAMAAPAPSHPPARRRRLEPQPHADGWNDVGAAWRVAMTVGAPLAQSLRGLASALRDAQEAADDVRVALAEPAGTARLMAWLPFVAVGLGVALGFDTVGTLFAQPAGIACLIAGIALIVAARGWTTRLVRRAGGGSVLPGLDEELLAVALSGGGSIDRGREVVESSTGRQLTLDAQGILALSRAAGVPAAELLRASAALARHRARIDGRLRAARLSTRLLLPLGVCTLPAFLLLGVAPMLLSVVSSMPTSF
jgi:tight adherence protein B